MGACTNLITFAWIYIYPGVWGGVYVSADEEEPEIYFPIKQPGSVDVHSNVPFSA